jgi:hypothetical protein
MSYINVKIQVQKFKLRLEHLNAQAMLGMVTVQKLFLTSKFSLFVFFFFLSQHHPYYN